MCVTYACLANACACVSMQTPQQDDNVNCGAFVCAFAEAVVSASRGLTETSLRELTRSLIVNPAAVRSNIRRVRDGVSPLISSADVHGTYIV